MKFTARIAKVFDKKPDDIFLNKMLTYCELFGVEVGYDASKKQDKRS